jgi:hypothetical protein
MAPATRKPRITQPDLDAYIAQLAAANAARGQALAAWEQSEQKLCISKFLNHSLAGSNRALREQLAEAEAIAGLGKSFKKPPPPKREPNPEEQARLAKMAAARDLAIRTGHTTKV